MGWKYVYGPVPSRRLGRSLGVNPIPAKTCNYSCVYCQLGRTHELTNRRERFYPPQDIAAEIREAVQLHGRELDYVTFVGEGEPTLCVDIGHLISETRNLCDVPIAVITNGSLLSMREVRAELSQSDVVMPSLDAGQGPTFRRINRPHGRIDLDAVVEGMSRFRDNFAGQLWVEVMLVRGVNDTQEELASIRSALDRVRPDRVFVNVPVRPPAESWVRAPEETAVSLAHSILEDAVVIDAPESGTFSTGGFDDPVEAVVMIVRRHPMRRDQIAQTLNHLAPKALAETIEELLSTGAVRALQYRGETYYGPGDGRYPNMKGEPTCESPSRQSIRSA